MTHDAPPNCPCGSGLPLDTCCGPIMDGVPASTAEALMRARYTAFVSQRIGDFLRDTLADEKRAQFNLREVELSARDTRGMGFEVRSLEGGGAEDDHGSVEYVARFKIRDQIRVHYELATFRRENGCWLYVDGRVNPKGDPRQIAKVGRNEPCPCGSGLKYKKCCGT